MVHLSQVDLQQRQYAALAPVFALAGVFIHPSASTLIPFILFFIFRKLNKPFAEGVALRTADLAFTIQLAIMLFSLGLRLALFFISISTQLASQLMSLFTVIVLVYFAVSLVIGGVQAVRGQVFRYWVSFRIAERIFTALDKKPR